MFWGDLAGERLELNLRCQDRVLQLTRIKELALQVGGNSFQSKDARKVWKCSRRVFSLSWPKCRDPDEESLEEVSEAHISR